MLTPTQAKERLRKTGKSTREVARELGVSRTTVEGVMSGRLKGQRGDVHKVAVALGLKEGVIVPDGMPIADALKLADGRAPRRAGKSLAATQKSSTARAVSPAPIKESAR